MDDKKLCALAVSACKRAYAPYSDCCVGAALLCASGKVYTGANIENASFGATICAERVAFSAAVHAGERDFVGIAVAATKNGELVVFPPCGICRQTMAEFCKEDFYVLTVTDDGFEKYTLSELLPFSFTGDKL